ncbi:MAG: UDP-N-acetylmuramoyl-L-alanyl-D-glutamate--2,6-diaminopimelate ligase [Chloroflexi bacterium]|nr:UDP-N-acetylmuramoyl-L-alanyl-D-glutamate--2,6-diaminopimelate ligase [Chloroflexota bacterium]
MTTTFSQLLSALPDLIHVTGDTEITAPVVESDADLQPGGVFVARRGLSSDGHDFIPRAIEKGAAAIVGERDITGLSVPYAQVGNAQEDTGLLAAAYHDFPARKLTIIGVTGTDGKTTTSTLIHTILQGVTDNRAGLISTVSAELGSISADTGLHVTTPGAPQVQGFLAQMVANGLTHAVLEMTSHGLAQGRLQGVDVDVAVMTNVTHEHLDYHGSFENYRAAKGRLFEMLARSYRKLHQPKIAIVNADDPNADFFAAFPADKVVRYSINQPADVRATDIYYLPEKTQFQVEVKPVFERPYDAKMEYETPLAGEFNVYNALAAIATGYSLHFNPNIIWLGLESMAGVPGRMERIDEGQPFTAIVDFAHTPNALENALKAARKMLRFGKRLIVVFGSAGLRDREKRRLMAEVAARHAHFTILTAEDPRTESLDAILEAMAQGCISQGGVEGKTFVRVPDRGEAIYRACQMAGPGDIVMACGKGHEQSMAFGTVEYPWDDREAMRAALRGQPLRTLPTAPTKM